MKRRHAVMPPELAILGAEQYVGPALINKAGKAKESSSMHPDGSSRKKRAKKAPVTIVTDAVEDGIDDDEGDRTKRTRGRPRLITKDQTAPEVGHVHYVFIYLHLKPRGPNCGMCECANTTPMY